MSKLIGQCLSEQLNAERALALSAESLVSDQDIADASGMDDLLLSTDLEINENDINTDVLGVVADTAEILESKDNITLPTRVAILESVESIAAILGVERKQASLESISSTDDILAYSQEGVNNLLNQIMSRFNTAFATTNEFVKNSHIVYKVHHDAYIDILHKFKPLLFKFKDKIKV